jgi:hypothetical protein
MATSSELQVPWRPEQSDHAELAGEVGDEWDSLAYGDDGGGNRVSLWEHPDGRRVRLEWDAPGDLVVGHGWRPGEPATVLRSPEEARRFMAAYQLPSWHKAYSDQTRFQEDFVEDLRSGEPLDANQLSFIDYLNRWEDIRRNEKGQYTPRGGWDAGAVPGPHPLHSY